MLEELGAAQVEKINQMLNFSAATPDQTLDKYQAGYSLYASICQNLVLSKQIDPKTLCACTVRLSIPDSRIYPAGTALLMLFCDARARHSR
jgi:hypothetical protein